MTALTKTFDFSRFNENINFGLNIVLNDIVDYINNRNSAVAIWDALWATNATTVPLQINNSTGTQNIANFQDNGTNVLTIADGGATTVLQLKTGTTSSAYPVAEVADASNRLMSMEKASTRTWQWDYTTLSSQQVLRLTSDGASGDNVYFAANVTGVGNPLWIWDPAQTLPDLPHTGIKPTFAVWGDVLIGDIIAIETNPMTYFMRASTGLAETATTNMFSSKGGNNDTDGGSTITMAPALNAGGAVTDGYISLTAYGLGTNTNANSIRFQSRSGVNTVSDRAYIKLGLVMGSATGGDKGVGTINCAGDIYKNDTAYTNPDYVFEHWFRGKVEKYAGNDGANDYPGLSSLDNLLAHVEENLSLPRVKPGSGEGQGIFERADRVLEKVEEAFLYIFQLHERLKAVEAK
jgi:hypothetical protein